MGLIFQFRVPVCDQHQRRCALGDRVHHQESAVAGDVVRLGCNGVANAGRKQGFGRANLHRLVMRLNIYGRQLSIRIKVVEGFAVLAPNWLRTAVFRDLVFSAQDAGKTRLGIGRA